MTPAKTPSTGNIPVTMDDPNLAAWLHGQESVLEQLERAAASDRLAHAYVFLGPAGGGKTRTALAFAQRLLDPTPAAPGAGAPEADEETARHAAYKKVAKLVHPDLHLVFPMSRDDAQNPEKAAGYKAAYAVDRFAPLCESDTVTIGIDQMRALKTEVSKARVEGPRRVVILSRSGAMTEAAAQSSLKLIEEPPPDTVLILAASDASQLLPTIVSRCQRVNIRPLSPTRIAGILAGELEIDEAEARLLAGLSRGSLGRAVGLRSAGIFELRERTLTLFSDPGSDPARIARRVDSIGREWNPGSARRMVDLMLTWYHDLLIVRTGGDDGLLVHADLLSRLETEARALDVGEIGRRLRILEALVEALGQWVNPALALHAALSVMGTGGEPKDLSYV